MGQIYNKREITAVPESSFRVEQLASNNPALNQSQQIARQAEREKADALELYSQGLSQAMAQNMSSMFEENQNDPAALQENFNKLNEKMSAEIPDERMKIGFKANFIVESQSYLNRAKNNQRRIQLQNLKDSNEQTIIDSSKAFSTAFYNMLTPDSTPDDVVNFAKSKANIEGVLNMRNEDGTLMYSPFQQERIRDSLKRVQVDSVKSYFNELPDYEKINFQNNLNNNNVLVKTAALKDGKGVPATANLADFMDEESMREIKSYANRFKQKVKEIKEAKENITPEEANTNAIENLVAIDTLNNQKEKLYSQERGKKGELAKGTTVPQMLDYRNAVKTYYIQGKISQKEYNKYMAETVNPLMKLVKEYDPEEGLPDPNLGKVYQAVVDDLDGQGNIVKMSDSAKAYILNQAYDMLIENDMSPDERKFKPDKKIKEIAQDIRAAYLQQKDPVLLTKDIDSVVMGNSIYAYTQGKGAKHVLGAKAHYKQAEDGSIYKVFQDAYGRVTNQIRIK